MHDLSYSWTSFIAACDFPEYGLDFASCRNDVLHSRYTGQQDYADRADCFVSYHILLQPLFHPLANTALVLRNHSHESVPLDLPNLTAVLQYPD
jgi:hypothetical protein